MHISVFSEGFLCVLFVLCVSSSVFSVVKDWLYFCNPVWYTRASMNSRLIRVLLVVIAIATGFTASYFLKDIENRIIGDRAAADALREQARALTATIAEVRAAQVAYVAQGQGEAFWMNHVAQLLPRLEQHAAEFGAALTTGAAQASFEPAAAAIENFQKLDSRVQEFVKGSNSLLAADLIFSDGLEATAAATMHVNAAVVEELQARQRGFAEMRRQQLAILGGAAGGVLLLLLVLGFTGVKFDTGAQPETAEQLRLLMARDKSVQPPKPVHPSPVKTANLASVAKLCTDLARVVESRQLPALLERTAQVLDASGVIVWMADPAGREMRPAMSYGYPNPVIAKMGSIARDGANALAAAYRSAEMRTVSGDNIANGALVAPLMTSEGCIGVLSVEMKGGSERDESSQALAAIFAAQLATLVSPPAAAAPVKTAAHA